MIKNQSLCPYCNSSIVAYDWDADKIIFNPDLAQEKPCKHLAYVGVYCLRLGEMLAHRHTVWLHAAADNSLSEYLRGIGVGTEAPDATYKVADAVHEYQHKEGTDAVTFCGIYSPGPEEFLRVCSETMKKNWHG
ncbi:MAG TPA: hypothetical protein VEL76_07825 [Gemmataceae bacterium]|nr:hypothetical protein [Gemmataceae bacterium]